MLKSRQSVAILISFVVSIATFFVFWLIPATSDRKDLDERKTTYNGKNIVDVATVQLGEGQVNMSFVFSVPALVKAGETLVVQTDEESFSYSPNASEMISAIELPSGSSNVYAMVKRGKRILYAYDKGTGAINSLEGILIRELVGVSSGDILVFTPAVSINSYEGLVLSGLKINGKFEFGEEISIEAPSYVESETLYRFKYWHKGHKISSTGVTINLGYDNLLNISYEKQAENAELTNAYDGGEVDFVYDNGVLSMSARPDEGFKFGGYVINNLIYTDETMSIRLASSEFSIDAIFGRVNDIEVKYIVKDTNSIVGLKYYRQVPTNEQADKDVKPPFRVNAVFNGWKYDSNKQVFYGSYTYETLTLTVHDKQTYVVQDILANSSTSITAKAKNFSYWSIDSEGKNILSYDKEYTICLIGDMEVYANYDKQVEKTPNIVICEAIGTYREQVYTITFLTVATKEGIASNLKFVEYGVVAGKAIKGKTFTPQEVCFSKASSRLFSTSNALQLCGKFSFNLLNFEQYKQDNIYFVMVGYLLYQDESGRDVYFYSVVYFDFNEEKLIQVVATDLEFTLSKQEKTAKFNQLVKAFNASKTSFTENEWAGIENTLASIHLSIENATSIQELEEIDLSQENVVAQLETKQALANQGIISTSATMLNINNMPYAFTGDDGISTDVEYMQVYVHLVSLYLSEKGIYEEQAGVVVGEFRVYWQPTEQYFMNTRQGYVWCTDANGNILTNKELKRYNFISLVASDILALAVPNYDSTSKYSFSAKLIATSQSNYADSEVTIMTTPCEAKTKPADIQLVESLKTKLNSITQEYSDDTYVKLAEAQQINATIPQIWSQEKLQNLDVPNLQQALNQAQQAYQNEETERIAQFSQLVQTAKDAQENDREQEIITAAYFYLNQLTQNTKSLPEVSELFFILNSL